jgi:hypothetical protein
MRKLEAQVPAIEAINLCVRTSSSRVYFATCFLDEILYPVSHAVQLVRKLEKFVIAIRLFGHTVLQVPDMEIHLSENNAEAEQPSGARLAHFMKHAIYIMLDVSNFARNSQFVTFEKNFFNLVDGEAINQIGKRGSEAALHRYDVIHDREKWGFFRNQATV